MKIQIDTVNNIIKIEEKVNLGLFIGELENLLPNGKWRKFYLEVNTVINWSNPIIIEHPIYPYSPTWQQQPWISCEVAGTADYNLNSGVYNIEI